MLNILFSEKFTSHLMRGTIWTKVSNRNSESFCFFKKKILTFIEPPPNDIFNCHNCKGIKSQVKSMTISLSKVFKISEILTAQNCSQPRQLSTISLTILTFLMKD